jgi:hypothetical protein
MRLGAEVVEQRAQVTGQPVEAIGPETAWLVAQVVAAQVGSDRAVAGGDEGRNLASPAPPELGEAVQQQDGWRRCRPRLDQMQAAGAGVEKAAASTLGERIGSVERGGIESDDAASLAAARVAAGQAGS